MALSYVHPPRRSQRPLLQHCKIGTTQTIHWIPSASRLEPILAAVGHTVFIQLLAIIIANSNGVECPSISWIRSNCVEERVNEAKRREVIVQKAVVDERKQSPTQRR